MRSVTPLSIALVAVVATLLPGTGLAQPRVRAQFNVDDPDGAPFPSNRFVVSDARQLTGMRINLPLPDCGTFPSDCDDIDALNELDGFNIQPRVSIPFSGPVRPSSLNRGSVILIEVLPGTGRRIGINEIVWDPATNTLHAESDEVLRQHSTYLMLVTNRIRDGVGFPIRRSPAFTRLMALPPVFPGFTSYERALNVALRALPSSLRGITVAASLFTTLSTTAVMEKVRQQVYRQPTPEPADFRLRGADFPPAVFPTQPVVPSFSIRRQTTTAPDFETQGCAVSFSPDLFPPAYTDTVAFGKYASPSFLGPGNRIPPVGTRFGVPPVFGTENLVFVLFLPHGPPPPGGWPVAIFGHGFESTKSLACILHDELNAAGIAVIAISAVGHDRGPLSFVEADNGTEVVTFPWGGRGFDQNGDGTIGRAEGVGVGGARRLIGQRDGMQQTVADLIQLTRVIEVGVDVTGDGAADLDSNAIYYFGHSNGGRYGSILAAVEPAVRAAALVSPAGGSRGYLALSNRTRISAQLGARVPSLLNVPVPPEVPTDYDADMPLRDEPVRIAGVPGAVALQRQFEWQEWARMPGDTVGFAFNLRSPPAGCLPSVPCEPKRILIQMAKGEKTVPNPDTSSWIRTGDLADVTTYLRWDLFWPDFCSLPGIAFLAGDPHSFNLTQEPELVRSRKQIATFFATDGTVIDNLGIPGPYWETPIVGPLPETLNHVGPCPTP